MTADLHDEDDDALPKVTPLEMPSKATILQITLERPAPPTIEEQEARIKELAALSDLEYERARDGTAARWGMRKSVLDKLVERERVQIRAADEAPGLDRQPAVETVSGLELVDELVGDLTRYVSLEPEYAVATAFWVIHTYLLDCTFITPRLAITAPEKRCGKSTLVNWLRTVVQRPMASVNITAAAVFHVVDAQHPTLLIDEADTFLSIDNELRGILNSGHEKGGTVQRWDARAKSVVPYSTFSACAISLIGNLPSTLQDRSIRVRLRVAGLRRRSSRFVLALAASCQGAALGGPWTTTAGLMIRQFLRSFSTALKTTGAHCSLLPMLLVVRGRKSCELSRSRLRS